MLGKPGRVGNDNMRKPSEGRSTAATIALIATAASTAASCAAILYWSTAADPATLPALSMVVPPLMLAPVVVGLAVWLAARRAFARGPSREEMRLRKELETCRAEHEEKQRTAKAHAAVARFMGAAVARLAQGDQVTRISFELPEPYRAFSGDFNTVMGALETARVELADVTARLEARARAIGEAAEQLAGRAAKLSERMDADLSAIDVTGERRASEALKIARYSMGAVRMASQRNAEAAGRFAELGRLVAAEARKLVAPAVADAAGPPDAGTAHADDMPDATLHSADHPRG